MIHYPATYRDAHGLEQTSISNDGSTLRMIVRGVEWVGNDFDGLEPLTTPDAHAGFTLNQGDLCACELSFDIPIAVVDANGRLSRADTQVAGSGRSGWFEDELLEIQQQLPAGTYLRACINCQYSDYSPAGHMMFGDMMCLRSVKDAYLRARTKNELWPVFKRSDGPVQETHVCDEFVRRIPGTGYRG